MVAVYERSPSPSPAQRPPSFSLPGAAGEHLPDARERESYTEEWRETRERDWTRTPTPTSDFRTLGRDRDNKQSKGHGSGRRAPLTKSGDLLPQPQDGTATAAALPLQAERLPPAAIVAVAAIAAVVRRGVVRVAVPIAVTVVATVAAVVRRIVRPPAVWNDRHG